MRNFVILIVAVAALAGCQLLQPEPEPEPEPDPVVVPEVLPPPPERNPLSRAIDYLQDGMPARAEELLADFLEQHPGHAMAEKLLEQVRVPPEELLGSDYYEVTVEPGDTLSELAADHLGDGLLFFALARFNSIEQPRLLQPGRTLRIPETEPPEDPAQERSLDKTVAAMQAADRPQQAYSLLLSAARAGGLSPSGRQQLVYLATDLSERALAAGDVDQAALALEQVEAFTEGVAQLSRFETQQDRVAARRAFNEAQEAGDAMRRHELLSEAVDRDPEWNRARTALANTEAELVEEHHDQALRAWRNQEIESAIELWEQVLAIDPGFEPAEVYLQRAREVLSRLEDL